MRARRGHQRRERLAHPGPLPDGRRARACASTSVTARTRRTCRSTCRRPSSGGTGADKITTGGTARTRVDGGDGNDVSSAAAAPTWSTAGLGDGRRRRRRGRRQRARARRHARDTVRCGDGTDRVDADTLDDVAADCEDVTRLQTAPPPESAATARRQDAAEGRRRRADAPARSASAAVVRVAATSSERGTIGASGFIDVGDLSLPIGTRAPRVGVAGGGAELTIKLDRPRAARRPAALQAQAPGDRPARRSSPPTRPATPPRATRPRIRLARLAPQRHDVRCRAGCCPPGR